MEKLIAVVNACVPVLYPKTRSSFIRVCYLSFFFNCNNLPY